MRINVIAPLMILIGRCYVCGGKGGRVERSFEAHRGGVTVVRWSQDGSGLLTGKMGGCAYASKCTDISSALKPARMDRSRSGRGIPCFVRSLHKVVGLHAVKPWHLLIAYSTILRHGGVCCLLVSGRRSGGVCEWISTHHQTTSTVAETRAGKFIV